MKLLGKAGQKVEIALEQDPLLAVSLKPGDCEVRTVRTIKGTYLVILRYTTEGKLKIVSKKMKEGRFEV